MKSEGNENMLYWKLVKQQQVQLDAENNLANNENAIEEEDINIDHDKLEGNTKRRNSYDMNDPFTKEEGDFNRPRLNSKQKQMENISGDYAYDKVRKDNEMRKESFTRYQYGDENARLRKISDNHSDRYSVSDHHSKVESLQSFSVSANLHSFHDSASDIQRKSSLIPVTHIQNAEGKAIKVPYGKMWDDLKGHRALAICSWICSAGIGTMQPLVGYFFGGIAESLAKLQVSAATGVPNADARNDLDNNLYSFLAIAFACLVGATLEKGGQAIVAQYLTTRIRNRFFTKLVNFDIEFFDDPDNSPGAIASSLEEDTNNLNNLMTDIIGLMFKNGSTVTVGVILAMSSSWRMSLVVLAVIPLMIFNGWMAGRAKLALEGGEVVGGNIVQENVNN